MTVFELSQQSGIRVLAMPAPEREIEGVYVGDLLSRCMSRVTEGCLWITIMSNINIIAVASLTDVACIVLAEGVSLDDSVRTTAEQKGVNVYTSEKTAYELAAMLASLKK